MNRMMQPNSHQFAFLRNLATALVVFLSTIAPFGIELLTARQLQGHAYPPPQSIVPPIKLAYDSAAARTQRAVFAYDAGFVRTTLHAVSTVHQFSTEPQSVATNPNSTQQSCPLLAAKFTGKERDAETGLDYFGARYLSAAQGRFTSPDAPFADQKPEDPQSWNLYSYVRNNPLRYTDPTGRCLYPGADCFQYLVGGAKGVANLAAEAATLLNRGINALTGANIPDAPRLEGANYDQRAGMEAAGFAMLVTPLAEAGAARISSAISGAARVEATVAAVEGAAPKLLTAPKARGNLNTAEGPAKVMVDSKGNAMPLKPGETLTGSPDGRFLQVRNAQGNPTGMRLDGPHKPSTHPDPRAQRPHAHVPGRTNPDGTPWLPVNQ